MHRIRIFKECISKPLKTIGCIETGSKWQFSLLGGKSAFRRIHRSECLGQQLLQRSDARLCRAATTNCLLLHSKRSMSTDENGGSEGKIKPVFVAIPNPIKVIRNNIFYWLIRSYFDPDFSIDEFTQGAKQALVTISEEIAEGTLENLEDLLSPKLLQEIKNTCRGFSLKEISSLSISGKDILHTFPHDIAIHYDDKGGKFLFILMKFWCHSTQSGSSDPEVKGFRIGKPPPGVSQEQFDSLGSVYSCTYEFHRNISAGANPQWMITHMQHGQLINTETRGLPEDE
ncbi:m-AAA protease-interacting protein 1, mitochondrial [Strongylocentrotus purpuratus]|uniref:Juvenile hormone esterase binding protein n=1 Tax=Strongylocentrotus purpuratus TaxID=7668 RepID=A0A7M7RF49_STRPU|nr:m-AAA protease-interacting protein 1, mitochondrial [Strongylocentrotus purpuratus]